MTDDSGWDKEAFERWNEKVTRICSQSSGVECQVRFYRKKDDVIVLSYRVNSPESEWHCVFHAIRPLNPSASGH